MISVIIPAYNDVADVLSCLNSLQALATQVHEFIVQDDASPEVDFRAVIHPAQASVQRNEVNLGFGGNCNAGAARARGDILFFVNQDINAAPGWSDAWDAALINAFSDPQVGIVGARLLFPNGSVQSAGGTVDARMQPVHRCLGWSNPHVPEVAAARMVTWVTGAALAIRRDLFMQIGGFDPAYGRGYWEDVELCFRARELGFRTWYEPRTTLVHRVGSTGGNPRFLYNALLWKSRWVDTGKVQPEFQAVHVRYW